jgi:uncharacterized protein YbjT (DUF2867 family)
MILVTSATGKTGRHVIASLAAQGGSVRALAHSEKSRKLAPRGVEHAAVGDMLDPASLERAMQGIEAVVHIGPAMHPKETVMGENVTRTLRPGLLELSRSGGTDRPRGGQKD